MKRPVVTVCLLVLFCGSLLAGNSGPAFAQGERLQSEPAATAVEVQDVETRCQAAHQQAILALVRVVPRLLALPRVHLEQQPALPHDGTARNGLTGAPAGSAMS